MYISGIREGLLRAFGASGAPEFGRDSRLCQGDDGQGCRLHGRVPGGERLVCHELTWKELGWER